MIAAYAVDYTRRANCIFFRRIYALRRSTGVQSELLFRYPPSGA
jgi:hypothetical protein